MNYQIDSISVSEYPEVVAVWEASVRATHHFLKESDIQFFKPLILHDYLKAVRLSCARDENARILGFMGVAEDKLEMLFIHPDFIGTGMGKALLQHSILNQGVSKVDVNQDNPQAVGFYEHMGFYTVSRSALDSMGKPYLILHMELKAK